MGFPTKNDHFGVFWGYHHLRKTPMYKSHHSPLVCILYPFLSVSVASTEHLTCHVWHLELKHLHLKVEMAAREA